MRRKAIIAFDSNTATNPEVRRARQALAESLCELRANVFFLNLPESVGVNGPDDFIARFGGEELLALMDKAEEHRPNITLHPGESPEAVDTAEEVLLVQAERLRIFQRGGEIVQVITLGDQQHSKGLNRPAGTVMLKPVGPVALSEVFDRHITWQRLRNGRNGPEPVRVDCPGKIADAYLSRLGSWRLPFLTGIISTPILRPDGTVVQSAGYDPPTGLFLTEDWPELRGKPSRDDALAALSELGCVFSEFPFVAAEDRSVLIAAILTALQRRLLASAPLFGFTAPAQRTGKSLLAECVAIIATGLPAPAMAVSSDREEMRKAVAATLREGHAVVNLDNVEHPLGSPDLSRAITQPEYADRILGLTRILRLPTNVLWTATGNNLAFQGDLAVRALLSRLDAQVERPEERRFKIPNLKRQVAEQRRKLVSAAITILRAYAIAGRPDQKITPWGGFDEWSATIRAPLVWLGNADPCATRQHVIEDDPERELAATILSAWHRALGVKPVRIAEVIERADSDAGLRSALVSVAFAKNNTNQLDPRRLAWWCRQWRSRIVKGFRLDRGSDHGDRASWFVKACAVSAVSAVISGPENMAQPSEQGEEENLWRGNNRNDRNDRNSTILPFEHEAERI